MSELPKNWKLIRVDEAGSVQLGRQRSPEHHSGKHMRPYLRVANVYENRIDTTDVLEMNFTPEEAEKFELKDGDILLNEGQSRELVGRPAMFRDEVPGACFQNTLLRFRAYDHVHPEYALALFRHYLRSGAFQNVCRWTTNIAHLGAARFAAMPFLLPPLAEQKRIADKLDRLLAAVDNCKARLDAIPGILKRFRQSVLAAAVSGKLTEGWRQERAVVSAQRLGLPTHWKMLNVADVCEAIVDCPHSTPKWTHTGRICVRTTDFRAGLLDLSSAKYVSEETYKERTRRIEPREGDVLYSREGTVGVACPVPPGVSICLGQRILLLRPSTLIHSEYLVHVLNSPATMRIVSQLTIGSTAPRVNVSNVKSFPLALPPLDEQGEIVRRIGSLFATADLVERALAAACLGTEALARSVLEKAFRGETVPSSSNSDLAILTGEITDLSRDTSPADSDHSSSSRKRRASVG